MNNKKHLSEVKRLIHIYETCNDSSLAKNYAVHLMRHHARYFVEQAERVQELESELNKQLEIGYFFEGETHDLAEQNKRYRELLTSKSMKQLIRLEDKGCFLPDEGREGFLDLKYAVEELEGEE